MSINDLFTVLGFVIALVVGLGSLWLKVSQVISAARTESTSQHIALREYVEGRFNDQQKDDATRRSAMTDMIDKAIMELRSSMMKADTELHARIDKLIDGMARRDDVTRLEGKLDRLIERLGSWPHKPGE